MQPFDDRSPDELDPKNEKVIAFFKLAHDLSAKPALEPEQETHALDRVRRRLLEVQQRQDEHLWNMPELDEINAEASLSSEPRPLALPKQGWSRRFALLAAVLVLTLIVGSLLTVVTLKKQAAFTAAGGQQPVYALSGGWLQKFAAQNGSLLWKSQVQISNHQAGLRTFTPASNGVVYISADQKIVALSANDGHLLWSSAVDGEIDSRPVFENTTLFVIVKKSSTNKTTHTSLEAFDAVSGKQLWQYAQDGLFASFDVVNQVVYGGINVTVPSTSQNQVYAKFDLFALKATDGTVRWRVHMNDPLLVSTAGEITVAPGKIYVEADTLEETASSAHGYSHLYTYDASNGAFLWHTPDALNPILGSLLPGKQTAFATSGAFLYALHEQNGQLLWSYKNKDGGPLSCSLTPQTQDILCLETEGSSTYMVELGANDGQVIARHLLEHFGATGIPLTPSPSANKGKLPQSTAVSRPTSPSLLLFPILLAGENVSYVVTSAGYLDAFDNQSGKHLWSVRLTGMPGPVVLMPED